MRIVYSDRALLAIADAPLSVRKAFHKQVSFLEHDLRHPSLQAKKVRRSQRHLASPGEPGLAFLLQD